MYRWGDEVERQDLLKMTKISFIHKKQKCLLVRMACFTVEHHYIYNTGIYSIGIYHRAWTSGFLRGNTDIDF